MPEGDTIHHAADRLREALVGTVPERVLAPSPRSHAERLPERLLGRAVLAVDAHGKHLFVRFDGGLTLHSHLRMSGAWRVLGRGQPWGRSRSRAWLVLGSGDRDVVQFDGPVLRLMSDARLRADPQLASLGQDVLGESFDFARMIGRLREADPTRPVGEVLIDQRIVAGIGNVWKAEGCWEAQVDPWRTLAAVSDEELVRIIALTRPRMALSGRDGPRTIQPRVYGKSGQPCPRCGTRIRARGQGDANRTTYWCPGCQR
jgi:endonuclease-8